MAGSADTWLQRAQGKETEPHNTHLQRTTIAHLSSEIHCQDELGPFWRISVLLAFSLHLLARSRLLWFNSSAGCIIALRYRLHMADKSLSLLQYPCYLFFLIPAHSPGIFYPFLTPSVSPLSRHSLPPWIEVPPPLPVGWFWEDLSYCITHFNFCWVSLKHCLYFWVLIPVPYYAYSLDT